MVSPRPKPSANTPPQTKDDVVESSPMPQNAHGRSRIVAGQPAAEAEPGLT